MIYKLFKQNIYALNNSDSIYLIKIYHDNPVILSKYITSYIF